MRFYPDRPDIVVPVQWYFVPADAPRLPFDNVFTSRVWYDGSGQRWPDLGEVDGAPRFWVRGDRPAGLVPDSCQTQGSVWTDGVPYALADSASHTPAGVLLCCLGGVMPGVDDVFCDDGSVFVNPHTGHVILHINVQHSNSWQILQAFQSAGPLLLARLCKALVGQVADLDQWQDNAGAVMLSVGPDGHVLSRLGVECLPVGGTYNPLQVSDGLGGNQFAISDTGQIETNQFTGSTGLGGIVNTFDVYDPAGTLVGRVPVYAVPPAFLIDDKFIDPNGTALPAHAIAPVNTVGASWSNGDGTWDIQANAAHVAASSAGWDTALLDTTKNTGTATAKCIVAGTGFGVGFRLQDKDNGWFALVLTAAHTLNIFERNAGVFTLRASVAYIPGASTVPVSLSADLANNLTAQAEATSVSFNSASFSADTKSCLATYAGGTTFAEYTFA